MEKNNKTPTKQIPEEEIPSKFRSYMLSLHQHTLKNSRFYTIVMFIIAFYGINQFSNFTASLNRIDKTIEKVGSTVIFVTDDGRVKQLTKEVIKIDDYAPLVANILTTYLPRSKANLLAPKYSNPDDTSATYKSWLEMHNFHKGVGSLFEFYTEFIDQTRIDGQLSQGEEYYKLYLSKLLIALRNKEVPYTLNVINTEFNKESDWKTVDNTFTMQVKINMIMSGTGANGISFRNRATYGVYKVEGYIDSSKASGILNPFGIKLTKIQSLPPKVPSDAVLDKELKLKKYKEEQDAKRASN